MCFFLSVWENVAQEKAVIYLAFESIITHS